MNLYRVDVKIVGTAYIKAASETEAHKLLRDRATEVGLEVEDVNSDVPISERMLDDPELPEISLSPAMTLYGLNEGAELEEVGEVPESAEEDEDA